MLNALQIKFVITYYLIRESEKNLIGPKWASIFKRLLNQRKIQSLNQYIKKNSGIWCILKTGALVYSEYCFNLCFETNFFYCWIDLCLSTFHKSFHSYSDSNVFFFTEIEGNEIFNNLSSIKEHLIYRNIFLKSSKGSEGAKCSNFMYLFNACIISYFTLLYYSGCWS